MKYKIAARTLQGVILVFIVENYTTEDGFVCFADPKTGEARKFHGANCEIREVPE